MWLLLVAVALPVAEPVAVVVAVAVAVAMNVAVAVLRRGRINQRVLLYICSAVRVPKIENQSGNVLFHARWFENQ